MSTRYLIKENTVILGLYKNGSQSLKQLSHNNPSWKVWEGEMIRSNTGPLQWLKNKDVTLYIPIRDEFERALSGLKEELVVDITNEINFKDPLERNTKIQKIVEDKFKQYEGGNYYCTTTYINKPEIAYFFKNIFLNKKWDGCTVKFFDMKYLSNKFSEFLGEDIDNIPLRNTAAKDGLKRELIHFMPHTHRLYREYFNSEWIYSYENVWKPIWDRMRDTEYWLHL